MDELETVNSAEYEKPPFSRVGWALFAILGITTALQLAGGAAVKIWAPQLFDTWWFTWAISFFPLYLIAIPIGYLIIRHLPKLTVPKQKLSFGRFIGFLAMCYAVMYIGNLIGTGLNAGIAALRGQKSINPLVELMTGSNVYMQILFVSLLAPIIEELVFRKALIDRIRVYGEGTAILVSGLMFGLFHGNLFQFFYAFGLGSMFAYIYIRTGKVHYTIILHAIINSMSVIMSQLLLNNTDTTALQNMGGNPEELMKMVQGNLPQLMAVGLCSILILALFISGLVLLIVKRKQAVLFPAPKELPKDGRFKAVFVNWGMGLFALLAVGMMVYIALA